MHDKSMDPVVVKHVSMTKSSPFDKHHTTIREFYQGFHNDFTSSKYTSSKGSSYKGRLLLVKPNIRVQFFILKHFSLPPNINDLCVERLQIYHTWELLHHLRCTLTTLIFYSCHRNSALD